MTRLFSAFVLAGIFAAFGWWFFSGREPKYDGRAVSYWFKEYCRSRTDRPSKEALVALQKMGTNAVPYLLEQAFNTDTDSTVKNNLNYFLNHMPRSLGLSWRLGAEERREQAVWVLEVIKPPAHQVISLTQSHLKSTNVFEHYQSLLILGTVGDGAEEVVPVLKEAMMDTNRTTRALAIQSLGWIGPRASAAVPALIEVMNDTRDPNYFDVSVAVALGKIGSNAVPALPLVRGLFERETNWNTRCSLAAALLRIDPDQTDALAFFTNSLTSQFPASVPASDRWIAAFQLGEIGPSAKAAVPALLQALTNSMVITNYLMISQVPWSLKKMGVKAEIFLPRVETLLRSKDETIRVNAAYSILYIDPAHHEAHLVLMEMIRKGSVYRRYAIDTLGDAGPMALEAVPVLRKAAEDNSIKADQDAARRALKMIQSKPSRKN